MSAVDLHEPDEMGVWDDETGTVWLPRSIYTSRISAIRFALREWDVTLPEVRCRARWMRYAPLDFLGELEDHWEQCDADAEGAFRVWRLEAA